MLLSLIAKIICFPVTWEKYLFGWTKLNADGSKQDNDLIGAGSILRDHRGDMIKVFSQKLGSGTSNLAEAQSALIRLQWCHSNGYDRVILECDSKLVVDILNNTITPPWHIEVIIMEAQHLIHQHNIVIRQCYREANNVADVLAKWSHEIQESMLFNYVNLPRQGYEAGSKLEAQNFQESFSTECNHIASGIIFSRNQLHGLKL